jgi:hypothetical protein
LGGASVAAAQRAGVRGSAIYEVYVRASQFAELVADAELESTSGTGNVTIWVVQDAHWIFRDTTTEAPLAVAAVDLIASGRRDWRPPPPPPPHYRSPRGQYDHAEGAGVDSSERHGEETASSRRCDTPLPEINGVCRVQLAGDQTRCSAHQPTSSFRPPGMGPPPSLGRLSPGQWRRAIDKDRYVPHAWLKFAGLVAIVVLIGLADAFLWS